MILLRLKKKRFYRIFFKKLKRSQLFTRTPRGISETSLHLHKHEKKGGPTFPRIDYLETNFRERKTGRIPRKRTKGKQCKTKASRRGEGVPGALPGFNKSVLRGVYTICAETVQREFCINLD